MQEETDEEATAGPATQAEKEKVTGLLSRAFHQPPKSLSLHNLLDLQPEQPSAPASAFFYDEHISVHA